MNENKRSVFAGILGDNAVLSGLMVISPVIVCGDHIRNALVLIYAFSTITFLSVVISSFVPRKLSYAVKIMIYAVISSLVYLPVRTAADNFFPDSVDRIGIYFPLLAVNSFIVFQSEVKFFRMPRGKMTLSLIFYIIGFDAVMLITAFIRELFAYGTINSKMADVDTLISGLGEPFGGFIFLGLMCGVYRKIRSMTSRSKNTARGETDASGK
ncbi:MAG: electron transport complex subunit E [Ruminococcus sp.]|nr:electron transport complex subunit E [Ruminococcus sp.]